MNTIATTASATLGGLAGPPWGAGPPPHAPFAGVAMLLLTVLVIAIAVLVVSRRTGGRPPWARPTPEETARTVLAERFARGDIDAAEFLERAGALNWTPGADR
ncbi:SHOCT domain-containing protein [Marinactinospora rubrisoli]|uniref:SHOCT domain-containing protein n=1 Tax=Marinactinospora rubrisoli TaxID=2715399 RepID=A0ABW2KJ05_9ACTN